MSPTSASEKRLFPCIPSTPGQVALAGFAIALIAIATLAMYYARNDPNLEGALYIGAIVALGFGALTFIAAALSACKSKQPDISEPPTPPSS